MAVSQNGYPAGNLALINRRARIPGTDIQFPGGIRKGAVEIVLMYVMAQVRKRVENTTGYGCWGYAFRIIRGGSSYSNHGSGTATDYNAPQHPLGVRGTWTASERAEILKILAEVDNVVRCGDFYSGRVDGMHFEINASLAAVERAAAKIAGKSAGGSSRGTLRRGAKGPAILRMQKLLWARTTPDRLKPFYGKFKFNGVYDKATADLVKVFGKQVGVNNSGEYGGRTRWWLDPPLLRRNSPHKGHIKFIQTVLNNRMGEKLERDGDYGPLTQAAVRRYQKAQGIPGGGGEVGRRTWNAIHRGQWDV